MYHPLVGPAGTYEDNVTSSRTLRINVLGSDFPVSIKGPSVSEVPEEATANIVKNGQPIRENPADEPEGTFLALIFLLR